jgi:CheY-like chemotaxis protein
VGRILIVDDEPLIGRVLSLLLSEAHEVDVETSAKDALGHLLEGERYDVILCDVTMPGVSGVDFHDEVARTIPEQASRIVFVTGGVTNDLLIDRIETSQRTVLDKPVDVDRLRAVVEAHVAAGPPPRAAVK